MKSVKLMCVCIIVGSLISLTASPASAATIIWQSANTDIHLGLPYGNLEFDNPLTGTEMVNEYAVREWRDASYAPGSPPWYDAWNVNDPVNIDGYFNEIWMRQLGHSIWTTTTIASKTVSIHLYGDDNDGLADIIVDGILVAQLDMGTPTTLPPQTALIIVKGLPFTTHHIQINDLGASPGTFGTDVATLGAAALEKHIKWSQPPKPTETDNLYYGWNEISEYDGEQIVADDWLCDNDDPVTDIHWWGSFKDWMGQDPPLMPESFYITFWTDVPDPNPDDPDTFSHPNDVVWEIKCTNFDYRFVGWDYDPKTNCYEACFLFEQYLTEAEYFYQKPSPDGTPAVYWISIAAVYPDGTIVENPWGWKARPRMFNDDAVQIKIPTNPTVGDKYEEGEPIYWPDPNKSWDMAFELTSIHFEPNIKWEQPPNTQLPGLHCHDSEDAAGNYSYITIADDWKCQGGEVTDLHWYGNYEMDALNQEIRGSKIRYFHISIHNPLATVACIPQATEIKGYDVPFSALTETDTGLLNSENCKIYLYEYDLPDPFPQEIDQSYWLDITAFANDAADPPLWRWQEAARSLRPSPYLCGAVTRTEPPVPGPWQTIIWPNDLESDMAFAITSTPLQESYVKWAQPPEPYKPEAYFGWNELSVYSWEQIAADDWFCDTADPVTDIHWWGSFIGWSCEEPPEMPESFHIAIWTDVPADPTGAEPFSHPGVVIWETDCDNFTSEFVGWDIDPRNPYAPPETCYKFEQDLPEEEWFYQRPGGNIYWLSIAARYPAGTEVQHPWGWKTRPRDPNSRAPDDAVKIFDPTAPVLDSVYMNGWPLFWPTEDDSWDLAFELTTKEIPPKPPVPHLKWSQPPIEIDPNNEMPVYCGWDEPSYSAPMAGAPPIMKVVADDYRCIGSMPVTSVHWWGSYLGWDRYIPPLQQPDFWLIGFWSNVPAGAVADFSYPETLLWQLHVSADRVKMEMVGRDEFPPNPDIFPETCFQYYVDLKEDEIFWQQDYLELTQDNTFWVSIVAVYSDTADIMNPWGWKTRPWSWMDDAVTFAIDGDILPGQTLHPDIIQPIEYQGQSYDVAFELDTDPNYIKWEQPFTGIRHWPHYEDEKSMARVVTTTEVVTKWLQNPDLTDMGVDVDATLDLMEYYPAQILADDFNCITTEAITGINIYGSWWHDQLPLLPEGTPNENWVQFTLSFHKDIPVEDSPTGYSMPGDAIWWWPFNPGEFSVDLVPPPVAPESYYMPCSNIFTFHDHQNVWKYSFSIPASEAFVQQGTEDEPVIYWLDVQATPLDVTQNPEVRFGWKTSMDHWNDDATWTIGREPYNGDWSELRYPLEHPYGGESIDLAFELTTQRTNTELVIDRLVADDWKCERKTPVTAVVWWGSYIGYEYKACYDEYMPPPVKPDYFQLSIWTDVPADADSTVPFSHPNEAIWKYNAYDYDEVLVGYDKHPHTPGTDPLGREPVFRYSVRLPRDEWFFQEDVNNIYWLSVVAVYKEPLTINYDWGWTNHQHVFNDDAVAGHYDTATSEWSWIDLYDQVGNSEDMSFMLFTDPNPILGTCWDIVECAGQPTGDATCDGMVNLGDLLALKAAWGLSAPWTPPYCCADFNHSNSVNLGDLLILKANWGSGPYAPSSKSQSCP